jgi:DNA polymerase alpha-associated DNA helicase A
VAEQPRGAERKKEREGMQKRELEGVVTKVQRTALTVALDRDEADVPSGKLWL